MTFECIIPDWTDGCSLTIGAIRADSEAEARDRVKLWLLSGDPWWSALFDPHRCEGLARRARLRKISDLDPIRESIS